MNLLQILKAMFTPAPRLDPASCFDRLRRGEVILIDVREPKEWANGVAEGAVLLSLSDFNGGRQTWKPFLEANRGRELLTYCAAGARAGTITGALLNEGFKCSNTGGLSDWAAAGWKIVLPAASR
jgi:rhodanese-related sulfurtransferase